MKTKNDSAQQPLTLMLQLTEEQRRQIQEQTGRSIAALPVKTRASSIRVHFAGLTLRVARGVFVPAPVSERLLQCALSTAPAERNPAIVEVGTGCGAISLATARARPDARVHASDISEAALRCARQNRKETGVGNVHFCLGSLLAPIPARLKRQVATVIANLPYVPPSYAGALSHFYPEGTAIGTGEDGLGLVRELADQARQFLAPGGSLALQLAGFQWKSFAEELRALGYGSPDFQHPIEDHAPAAARIRFPASR